MKKWLVTATAAVATAALLAGCSSSNTAGTADDKDVTLTYGVWSQDDTMQALIDAFEKENPTIKVDLQVSPFQDYWTKLQVEASGGTAPDAFWMLGDRFQLYASNDQLLNLDDAIKDADVDMSVYPKPLVDLFNYDGHQFGLPKDFDTIGLWYNKAIFAEAGVEVPTDDWTWDDLTTAAQSISDALADSGIYGVAAGMDGQTTYYNPIFQAGGEVIAGDGTESGYDSDASREGLTFWSDLIESGASPSMEQLTDTPADQWFTSGKLAMYYGGSWARAAIGSSDVKDDVDVAPLPAGKEKATVIHGVANVVAANSKNKQAAQALQVYLASKEAQEQQGDMGAIIPAFEGTQAAFAESYPGMNLQVFLDATAYARPLPVSKNSAAWNALEAKLLPDVFSDGSKASSVTKDLGSQMSALLAKE